MNDVPTAARETDQRRELQRKIAERLARATDRAVPPATAADQRVLMDNARLRLDTSVTDSIAKRYGNHIPKERLDRARRTPTDFVEPQKYQQNLMDHHGLSADEAKRCLGHYEPGTDKLYVSERSPVVLNRIAHERLHQLSHEQAPRDLGEPLYEGITQQLAVESVGDPHLADAPSVYPAEVRHAGMLRALGGEEALARAYFAGDPSSLRQGVDGKLGKGSFDEIIRLTKDRRWNDSAALIHSRNRGQRW